MIHIKPEVSVFSWHVWVSHISIGGQSGGGQELHLHPLGRTFQILLVLGRCCHCSEYHKLYSRWRSPGNPTRTSTHSFTNRRISVRKAQAHEVFWISPTRVPCLDAVQWSPNCTLPSPLISTSPLPFLSGFRFLSTGGGSQSATGTGLLGGVFGLDLKPIWAGGGTCIPNEEKSNVPGVMGT